MLLRWGVIALGMLAWGESSVAVAQTLEERLLAEGNEALAAAAWSEGDAARGAVLFHQAQTSCARCHTIDGCGSGVGPDLTVWPEKLPDSQVIEAILQPSKRIRQGFETATVALSDGRTLVGIVKSNSPDEVVFKEATGDGRELRISRGEIEELQPNALSVMPAGVANQLTSRGQFLDLVRYVLEIRDGGVERAKALQPPAAAYALQLPEYENHLDHAGLIRTLDEAALDRGASIYARVCRNCHGTREQAGSLPTSLKFASGAFKNGNDPYSMYRTLTHGFGQMTPQTWMVPQQKYDVIHYLRETYLKPYNAAQYAKVDEKYLESLPRGDTRGPEPTVLEPWATMDYGPSLIHTYEVGTDGTNFAQKGIAVRLDAGPGGIARGSSWMVFDHDTMRVAAAWEGSGFVDWQGVQFDGQHFMHPRPVGDVIFANPTGPGWADPKTGKFDDDQRVLGRDGRNYGPLPKRWARYRGLYQHHGHVVISYSVGDANILEMPGMERQPTGAVYTRAFQIGPRETELRLLVATSHEDHPRLVRDGDRVLFGAGDAAVAAGISRPIPGAAWCTGGPRLALIIPPGNETLRFVVWMTRAKGDAIPDIQLADAAPELDALTAGSEEAWPERLTTTAVLGKDDGPFAADVLTPPDDNPWLAQMRLTGLDFFDDGDRAAICSWDGDVWVVSGLSTLGARAGEGTNQLTWHRVANGLFQPLGLKIIDGVIHLTCRDQLVVLRDLNGDGATDFYECLNNDQQVTEHFHEFAMGLQTDAEGNFYYAKSARHALPAVVPQHGTLLRVSRDGEETTILANGFRAANGVCLNPDGSFFVTDQEGHWNPKNRINWVTLDPSGKPKFYGNMFGYHDVTDPSDDKMEPPLCWITNAFDRSPAELLWTPPDAWGPLGGALLNLSYGYGKIYVVPHEKVGGVMQGGMCELPLPPFPTGVMRGRFHPVDRQLYTCGMFAWAGSAIQPGGLYRVRHTGKPMQLPVELHAKHGAMQIGFTDRLDRKAAENASNYHVKVWALKRTEDYGSDHYNEHALTVSAATLSEDGRTVTLAIPDLAPTWCMEIEYALCAESGKEFTGRIHNTVHRLGQ